MVATDEHSAFELALTEERALVRAPPFVRAEAAGRPEDDEVHVANR